MTSPLHLEQQRFGERTARADDRDAVAALAADDHRVLARLPADLVAARIRAELSRDVGATASRPTRWVLWPGFAAVATVASVVVLLVKAPVAGDDRLKGASPLLELRVAETAGPRLVRDDDHFTTGDVVQVSIRAAGAAHGVVVSIDGSGGVTRHFPDGVDTTLPRAPAALPFSFELDAAPDFERFILVTSEHPLDVEQVLRAAQRVAAGQAPKTTPLVVEAGALQHDVVLRKRPSEADHSLP
jgi:hypothetical protein